MSGWALIDEISPFSGSPTVKWQFSVSLIGERVSGKGADLYEMCDELDAILTGNITDRVHDLIINIIMACVCRRYNTRSDWVIVTELFGIILL